MSKKNKHNYATSAPTPAPAQHSVAHEHAHEYRYIQGDLVRLIIVNALFLAALLALYYTNNQSHYLEQWFGKINF